MSQDISKMETAKDILRKYDVIMIGENPKSEAAIKEIADKAWEAPLDAAIHKFEEAKKSAGTLNDMVFIDVVLAVLDSIKSGKSRDKETFMKSLFPLKEI